MFGCNDGNGNVHGGNQRITNPFGSHTQHIYDQYNNNNKRKKQNNNMKNNQQQQPNTTQNNSINTGHIATANMYEY